MSGNGYKKKTPLLGIPVPWYKDRIHPETEYRKACIIENMLIAGTAGVKNALFDDGSYRLETETEDTYQVRLSATGPSPSAEGMVGGAYFKAPSTLIWPELKVGRKYFLYIKGQTGLYEDYSRIRTSASTHRVELGGLLMAVVDLREKVPELNKEPDGKLYTADLARHMNDYENPHGRRLYQEELVVTEKLILRKEGPGQPVVQIEVEEDDVREFPASAFSDAIGHLAGKRVEVVDFKSGGPEGVVVRIRDVENPKTKIFYVEVQRRVTGAFSTGVGEIGVGYMGQDPNVDENLEFAVYNTGEAGIEMRAIIYCG